MKNFFKGFIVGIGKVIPGVSGAMIAISMGIYDKAIECICNFKNNKKESIRYLLPIGIGIILSIVFFSKIISILMYKFYLVTMLFFVGLIIGGLPSIVSKVKKNDYYIVIAVFVIFFLMSINNLDNLYVFKNSWFDFFIFFVSGIVEAIGTVVPGISSTALLMIIGTYNNIISAIGNFDNIKILIPFIIGLFMGLIVTVKVINYLFNRYKNKVFAFILGILLSSIVLLVIQAFKNSFSFIELIIGLIFMVIGVFVSSLLKEK